MFTDLALERWRVLDERIQGTIFHEPARRRFRPNARYSGNVVRRISYQCKIVHHAFRRHAEFRNDCRSIDDRIFHGVQQRDVITNQLRQILVAGDDEGL